MQAIREKTKLGFRAPKDFRHSNVSLPPTKLNTSEESSLVGKQSIKFALKDIDRSVPQKYLPKSCAEKNSERPNQRNRKRQQNETEEQRKTTAGESGFI